MLNDPIVVASILIGCGSLALIAWAYKNGKSLNPLGTDVRSTSPFTYAEKFRDRVEDKAEENNQIPDLQVSQLDNLLSHAVAHGREIERAKGQNSDKMYKMVLITMALSGTNLLGILYLAFG